MSEMYVRKPEPSCCPTSTTTQNILVVGEAESNKIQ